MAGGSDTFEVCLQLGLIGRHRTRLSAKDVDEAIREATLDAVATSGGEFDDWSIASCDLLDISAPPQPSS
jgi:hypothetical protein